MESIVVVVQLLGHVKFCVTPWIAGFQASLSFTISRNLLTLMSTELSIQPSHPLSFPSSPAPNPSQHQGLF